GHTLGHTGVAVSVGERWLLNAGDAYFFHREVDVRSPRCPPGLGLYQTMMEKNRAARLWNQKRLRDLRRDHPGEIEVFCSHDVKEFERHAGRPATRPAGRWGAGPALERGEGAPGAPCGGAEASGGERGAGGAGAGPRGAQEVRRAHACTPVT